MLLFVYWECCCLYIGNDVAICELGMMLLFVHWECCCYLGSWNAVVVFCIANDVVICALEIMLLFG